MKRIGILAFTATMMIGMMSISAAEDTARMEKPDAKPAMERNMGKGGGGGKAFKIPTDERGEEMMPHERMQKPEGDFTPHGMKEKMPGAGGKRGGKHFRDVSENEWYSKYVDFVSEKGIMEGKDGEFGPDNVTTRADYIVAIYKAAGSPEVSEASSFEDVDEDAEYAAAVAWAEANGIATGNENNEFLPEESLTREMAMTFLYRALDVLNVSDEESEEMEEKVFNDSEEVSEWAKAPMKKLVKMGIIGGTDEGKLNPKGKLVNSEVAAMIYRILGGNKTGMPEMRPDKDKIHRNIHDTDGKACITEEPVCEEETTVEEVAEETEGSDVSEENESTEAE